MIPKRASVFAALAAFCLFSVSGDASGQTSVLNVSCDVSRELYKDTNPAFIAAWKVKTGEAVAISQSHRGSSKQALALSSDLEADIVTVNR
jgi:sulfate/thiosulfate transport system substrate-binding protein